MFHAISSTKSRTYLVTFVILLFALGVSVYALYSSVGVSAQPSANIIAYKVKGNADIQHPGSAKFWQDIPWVTIPLSANVPNGGHTPAINVKVAWNGTYIFVLLTWNATKPSNRMSSVFSLGGGPFGFPPLWYNQSSGQFVVAPPRSVEENIVKYYYVNSTYYSQDRVAMMWYLGGQTGTPDDCMVVGRPNGGALEAGGAANIWDFMTGATWNTTTPFLPQIGYPLTPLSKFYNWWNRNVSFTGVDYQAPPTGFALNLYTNATDLYEVGLGTGLFYTDVDTNHTDPFVVQANAIMGAHSWTVEMIRQIGEPVGGNPYLVNITPGNTYDVAFAVWQGYYGENAFIKSISTFQTLYISTSPPPAPPGALTPAVLVVIIGLVLSILTLVVTGSLMRRG